MRHILQTLTHFCQLFPVTCRFFLPSHTWWHVPEAHIHKVRLYEKSPNKILTFLQKNMWLFFTMFKVLPHLPQKTEPLSFFHLLHQISTGQFHVCLLVYLFIRLYCSWLVLKVISHTVSFYLLAVSYLTWRKALSTRSAKPSVPTAFHINHNFRQSTLRLHCTDLSPMSRLTS